MTGRRAPLDRAGSLSPAAGLAAAEVPGRRERWGANHIVDTPPGRWRALLLDTARDPMLWFLAAVGALYLLVGQAREAAVLLAALAPLVGMDLVLHHRTQASTESLRGRLAERAVVVRDGIVAPIPAVEVVPGDLLVVAPGEGLAADGLVVAGDEVQVDESTLTGEAYPVRKRPLAAWPGPPPEPVVAAEHWVSAGTRLLTGPVRVRVVFTGGETLYGEIVRSARADRRLPTPLQQAIGRLVRVLVAAASVVCLTLALVRLGQGHGWVDAVVSAVTLAAAALPEEFPVVFTVFLGVGVYRLARRQALVRRAVSVENIGRVSAICADKTGTITEGRLRLADRVPAAGTDEGGLLVLAVLASRADSGDPLDEAVVAAARAAGVSAERGPALAVFPFTETRRRETAVVRDGAGVVIATKGAPEIVLAMTELDGAARTAWTARAAALAAGGRKVLACAWQGGAEPPAGEPAAGYRLAGLLAFEDPVREGVAEAVARCRQAGIHAVMVTGDHADTALAVARQVGLGGGHPRAVTGDDVETLVQRGEERSLRRVDVVARARPGQKLALVRALQASGEVVAVTGDGVNDVPALQAADVGVAMGERGTRSARETAAIVLLDDNFRTIVAAIAEGRQLFENLRLSFAYLIVVHIPLVATAALLPLAGFPLLYLPVHIVGLELMIHPTALLVFQQRAAGPGPARPGPGRALRFFSRRQWAGMAAAGGLVTALVAAGFVAAAAEPAGVAHGRSAALATLALTSAAVAAALSRLRTGAARLVTGLTVAAAVMAVQVPPLAALLHLTPLHAADWARAVGGAVAAGGLGLTLPGPASD